MLENENSHAKSKDGATSEHHYRGPWGYIIRGMWRSPLGLMGVAITTVSISLMLVGLIIDQLGLVNNPYASIVTYTLLPAGMVIGLAMIPLAAYLRRRQWTKYGIAREHLSINLSDHKHRKFVIGFIALTVINVSILAVIGYEGYHFTDSPYFCGMICHKVMAPEYTAYQRSPHARVACVECHIGPGASWFVRAKLSGLRQVFAVLAGTFHKPVPAPVEHLRPARDTCEQCHWPEKFHGKRVKNFTHFSNIDQVKPQVNEIALHIGGRNPRTGLFEGIHWHVSHNVEVSYIAADEKRTRIAKVKVKRPDGTVEEFSKKGLEAPAGKEGSWRVMDCIDCHNRPTHVYDLPEERVDFGLLSKRINPEIPGIREDSLIAITRRYNSQEEAKVEMVSHLLKLQALRGQDQAKKYEGDIRLAGEYLLDVWLANVWPEMEIQWGTYRSHLGHQYADEGYGCFRCHDEEHETKDGKTIPQDCSQCHDEPA